MSELAENLPFPTTHKNELDPETGEIVRDVTSNVSYAYRYYMWDQDKPNLVDVHTLETEYLPEIYADQQAEMAGEM